ncbi:MAG: amino acid ABC transporter substrate-binding protein [Methylocystis sp.]|nr:amino acid ABC transporter substrate-binding protein [Methylocystis sp.]
MTSRFLSFALAGMLAFAACFALAPAAAAQPGTLEQIQKRRFLICGANKGLAGFGRQSDTGAWTGFDVDFCRALAAAIFDDPSKVRFTPLSGKERFTALQSGEIDILSRNAVWTQSRDTGQGLLYAAVTFFDGQGFLTRKSRGFEAALALAGASICVQQGTSFELDLVDFFRSRKETYEPRLFATFEEAAKAYDAGLCDALTADASALWAQRLKLEAPSDHGVLADLIAKEPLGPIVRQGDDQWFNIVRWTHFAMIDAEELGVTSANVDQALKSESPEIRRLLGIEGDHGDGLGLSADWAYRIVKHVGSYGEVFERNLGRDSPLGIERRLNALWSKGGIMYAPPVR